jgi:hypothetical protein
MIRISVTTLEQFRRVCTTSFAREEELARNIGHPEEAERSWQMVAGSAWDKLLTNPLARASTFALNREGDTITLDGCQFSKADVEAGLSAMNPVLGRVTATQLKLKKTFDTFLGHATVVGKLDAVWGGEVIDVKARFSPSDPTDYEEDLQWRFYLDLFAGTSFRYVCCEMKGVHTMEQSWDGIGVAYSPTVHVITLEHIHQYMFYPYNGMREDCFDWLERFLGWARQNGLLKYLDRSEVEEEVPV